MVMTNFGRVGFIRENTHVPAPPPANVMAAADGLPPDMEPVSIPPAITTSYVKTCPMVTLRGFPADMANGGVPTVPCHFVSVAAPTKTNGFA